jgi:hypothetical protein
VYHCIKELKIYYYNSVWPNRHTPNSPTRYYMKMRYGADKITPSVITLYTDNLGEGVRLKQ